MSSLPVALLSMALFAGLSAPACANSTGSEVIADAFATHGELVALSDGRALNLRCSGEGEPVVILEAGGNADSSTWYLVQPQLARLTRVCAYDRAGYGFSDEGPYPRDLVADVADLHALIQTLGNVTPVVLVGHSLGSNIVRKYAQLYPQEVAGLVLVDPPEQGADDQMPQEWQSQVASMLAQREEILAACERAALADDMATMQQTCLRKPPHWMSESVVSAMTTNKSKPSYWRTLRSELAHNIGLFSVPVPADESYGSIPLVVLRATEQKEDAPGEVLAVIDAKRAQTFSRILAASTDSNVIDVTGASHDIQLDQPGAVVNAIQRLLGPKAKSAPPPSDS